MCGIAGLVPFKPGASTPPLMRLERAALAMRSRGPDASWVGRHGSCALATTRLAIVDRTKSSDPPIYDPTGRVLLLYNGELYDSDALREILRKRGHRFRSKGDGEIVLAAYLEYGIRFLREIDGMFALAIVDLRQNDTDKLAPPRVILARDRFGEKPLLFARAPAGVAFASTAAAIRKLVSSAEINPESLAAVMRHGFIPGGATPLRGVFRMRPGTALVVANGEIAVFPFAEKIIYEMPEQGKLVPRFWELLRTAVRRRARSDAGLGLFLSGGLDSAAIGCALVDEGIHGIAYTAGFRGVDDERALAALTAKSLGLRHEFIEIGPEILELWEPLTRELGEPIANASMLNIHALAKRASRDVKVVLSGEGGDELFGGYRRERAYSAIANLQLPGMLQKAMSRLPGEAGRVGRALARKPGIGRYQELRDHVSAAENWLLPDFKKGDAAAEEGLPGETTAADSDLYSYLPNDLLFRLDAATMAASVEARAPFLDPQLADFARGLPSRARQGVMSGKKLVREALAPRLPEAVIDARKRGFGAPLSKWFRETDYAERVLLDSRGVAPPLDRAKVIRFLREHKDKRADHSLLIARAIAVELFRRTIV
ncbi:MAG: asparagine synthase (glutamine-hydrolyzing) [Planctomycetes bacterium]|nr:asparagine synthase (glutamine-hydrolyzing) [Planctomycetota bacterium]